MKSSELLQQPKRHDMRKYNKAMQGGAGAAIALILAWIASLFGLEVPKEVESAFTVILAAVGPMVGPANS